MALLLLQQALEKDITIKITPQDVSATGILTDNAAGTFPMNGRITTHGGEFTLDMADLTPAHSFVNLPVPHQLQGTFRIEEIVQALPLVTLATDGFDKGNTLFKCSKLSYYHKIQALLYDHTAPTPVVRETETMYMVMQTPRSVDGSRTGVLATSLFQLIPVYDTVAGAFIANPAYS